MFNDITSFPSPPTTMSHRFDFKGVDIERIKKNLKVRSGRGKKSLARQVDSTPVVYGDVKEPIPEPEPIPPQTLTSKKSSPTIRTFDSQNLLPIKTEIRLPPRSSASPSPPFNYNLDAPLPPLPQSKAHLRLSRSAEQLRPPAGIEADEMKPANTDYSSGEEKNFDLRPPPPNRSLNTLDGLSEHLFSNGHLRTILHDPSLFIRFTAFLNRYNPHTAPILIRYLETQKAIKAVEYANAVAETVPPLPGDQSSLIPCAAALIDARFEQRCKRAFEVLAVEALPSYITYNLVKVVTECMVKEITGMQMPVMRDLVGGLTEVFCLTDPGLKDNPIVYASEGMSQDSLSIDQN